jgi:hypothetical protein
LFAENTFWRGFKETIQDGGTFCRYIDRSSYMGITSISSGWGSSACPTCGTRENSSQKTGSPSNTAADKDLSKEDKVEVTELKKRDKEVRAHEAAHVAAGGQYVRGGASFEFQTGPDGQKYAVGGEVPIDTSPAPGDPGATIRNMQVVKAAALAPAQPSGADRAIAAEASAAAAKAQAELLKEQAASAQEADAPPKNDGKTTGKNAGLEQGLAEQIKNTEKNNSFYATSTPTTSIMTSINILA